MTRPKAIDRIRAAGHVYVEGPDRDTTVLVVGQDGPPIGDDGHLTKSLLRARALQAAGHGPRIVSESEWLESLNVDVGAHGALHSAVQLARMIDVPRATVRGWVRRGLLRPARAVRRLQLFGFSEIAHARAIKRLIDAGASPARIAASLRQLRTWLPETACGAAQLDHSDDDALLVRTEEGTWVETDGQLRLDFDGASTVQESAIHALRPLRSHFEQGIQAEEEGDLEEAATLYERAIAVIGPRADVCFNLGNVLYALGRPSEAASRFREATSLELDHVEAWNNLGNVLAELHEPDEAIRAFRHALAIEPLYGDAHFNLAGTLADMGNHAEARRHWHTYLTLDNHSTWADEARQRLDEI